MNTLTRIPSEVRWLFVNPPVLKSEDPKLYWNLADQLIQAIQPKDIVEWLSLKDAADNAWEVFRLQRLKCATIDFARAHAIETVLRTLLPVMLRSRAADVPECVNRLTQGWFGDGKQRQAVLAALTHFGLTESAIEAEALTASASKLQQIEEMLGIAVVRRDASIREIERRREVETIVRKSSPVIAARVVEEVAAPNAPSQK
jgi:hypothetical protein